MGKEGMRSMAGAAFTCETRENLRISKYDLTNRATATPRIFGLRKNLELEICVSFRFIDAQRNVVLPEI